MNQKNVTSMVGFALCAAWVALGQVAIGRLAAMSAPGAALDAGMAQDVGYTFTGLTALLGFALWRWGRAANPDTMSPVRLWATRMSQALAAMLPALMGCAYTHLAGMEALRHARAFAALPPLLFLLATYRRRFQVRGTG